MDGLMRRWVGPRMAFAVAVMLVVVACGAGLTEEASSDESTPVTAEEPIGVPTARVRVAQEQTDCCYVEGQVSFLRLSGEATPIEAAYAPGAMVSVLDFFEIPPGEYRLESWQRSCALSCPRVDEGELVAGSGSLDPGRRDECALDLNVAAGDTLDIGVRFTPGVGCSIGPPTPPTALAIARRQWLLARPVMYSLLLAYDLTGTDEVGRECGEPPLLVLVEGDRPVKAIDRYRPCEVDLSTLAGAPLTIDRVFGLIDANLDAERLDVTYDDALGFPVRVNAFDGSRALSVWVSNFWEGEGIFARAKALMEEVDRQRAAWRTAAIGDYSMTVSLQCMCEPAYEGPFDVTVRDGEVTGVEVDGVEVRPPEWVPVTVEELFDLAAENVHSSSIVVDFAAGGYPESITVDREQETIDDEFSIRVTSFEAGDRS